MATNTMDCGNIKEFPSSARPLWSLAVGESLNLLNMMNNTVYFTSFPFIALNWLKDVYTIINDKTNNSDSKGHSSQGHSGKFLTFQSYLNTVPRINLASDEVYCQINPERRGIICQENCKIKTDDEIMQECLGYVEADFQSEETDSNSSLIDGEKDSENPQNIPSAEARLEDDVPKDDVPEDHVQENHVPASNTYPVLYQSTSKHDGFACAPPTAARICLRCSEYETEAMRKIKHIPEGIDGENTSDEDEDCDDDDDVTSGQMNFDVIQRLKMKSNEYIRNDFDLLSSKRLPLFDIFSRKLPRYDINLSTGLLVELLNSFGMKFKISKYKDKPNRLNSNQIFCKNLFLKDRKGQFYYIICNENENLNLKKAAKYLGACRNLSFASEADTNEFLHVEKGGLTPFALLYDRECKTKVVCTTDLLLETDRLFNFHPFDPNLTLCLSFDDLKNYLAIFNHSVDYLPI